MTTITMTVDTVTDEAREALSRTLGRARRMDLLEARSTYPEPFRAGGVENLGSHLTYWHLPSHRLMVVDNDLEFAYTWCGARKGWNDTDWDVALTLMGRNDGAV